MNVAFNYGYWDLWRLYHKVTFDGVNRIIYVNDGVTELNIKTDIYSDWKEWVYALDDNAVWLPAIRAIGGDPTVAGETAGDIYFLQNGWKLYIDLTKVKVSGVLFSDDFDSAYYDYSGNIQYPAQVSSLVSGITSSGGASAQSVWEYGNRTLTQEVASDAPTTAEIASAVWGYITRTLTTSSGTSPQEIWEYANRTLTQALPSDAPTVEEIWSATSRTLTENPGPTAAEIADSVWDEAYVDHDTDGTMGHLLNYSKQLQKSIWVNTELTNGNGSQENPYNNIQDAVNRAEEDNIRTIYLIGDVILTQNFKNFYLIGIGVPEVDLNGQDVRNSHFSEVKLKGSFVNGSNIVIRDSVLLDGAYLDGFIENSALGGNLICNPNSAVFMKDCASAIPGTNRPTISMNPAATSQLSVRGYNGGLTIFDCNQTTDRVTVELSAGSLTFDSSCTNGIMVARGVGKFVDNTTGAAVFDETINQEMLDTLEALATNIQSTTDTINANTDTVEASLAIISSTVNTINTNTDTVEASLTTLSSDLSVIGGNVTDIETLSNQINAGVITLNNINIENRLDAISATTIDTNTTVSGIETTVNTININTAGLATTIPALTAAVNTIDLNTDTVEASLASLTTTVNTINTNVIDIEGLSNTINTNVNAINALNIDSRLNSINSTTIDTNTTVSGIETTVNTININTAGLGLTIPALTAAVDTIDLNTDTVEASLASLTTTVNTINTNVIDIEGLSNTINTNVNAINALNIDSRLNTINTNVIDVQSTINSIEPTISTINTNTAGLLTILPSIETTVDSTNTLVTGVIPTINTINTNTDTLETSIAAISSTVNTINTNVATISGNVNNLQITIDAVNTDVEANQTLLNALQSSLNLVAADVTTVDGKVTTINNTTQSTNTEVLSKLLEVWRILGLDSNNPQTITDVSISVGDITLSISQPDASTTEVSRQ